MYCHIAMMVICGTERAQYRLRCRKRAQDEIGQICSAGAFPDLAPTADLDDEDALSVCVAAIA